MDLETVLDVLQQTPAVVHMHPVSLCYLPDDVMVVDSPQDAMIQLDQVTTSLPMRWLIKPVVDQSSDRFPTLHCTHEPFTEALNAFLFERFDTIASSMLCQSTLATGVANAAQSSDIVVFLVIDGLAYRDLQERKELCGQQLDNQPCLVDVPSLTRIAFPNIIGSPSVAARLFDAGYHKRLGVSYWTREDNKLTDQLFHTIPDVLKTGEFAAALSSIRSFLGRSGGGKRYVQIVRTGLDGYAHSQKRRVPVNAIVEEIWSEFEQLAEACIEICENEGICATLFLTSDHGILWNDEFDPIVIGDAPGKASSRWCVWNDLFYQRKHGRRFLVGSEEIFSLGFPHLRRPLRIDEQGVHGGISFQESVVPFITARFGTPC